MFQLRRMLRPAQSIPEIYRRNFTHWYFDIAWFGVLNGSVLVFLAVYCARIGASVEQLGFLGAAPAVTNLVLTLPLGVLITRWSNWQVTRWSALFTRLFYLFLIPLPLLLGAQAQVWTILVITLVMNIPGTLLSLVVNTFLADTVPAEYRATVVGTRNALLALITMGTTFIVGQILELVTFPTSYVIVFAIGFFGAAMSTLHLFLIRPRQTTIAPQAPAPLPAVTARQPRAAAPRLKKADWLRGVRFELLRGPYGVLMLILFCFQLGVFTPGPLFPKYQVDVLHYSDQFISFGSMVFWVVHFIGSTQTGRISRKFSYRTQVIVGSLFISAAVAYFPVCYQFWQYAIMQTMSGIGWSLIGGGLMNHLLECAPEDDRQPYLTWYNLVYNGAILAGSFLGPQLANVVGLAPAMYISVGIRMVAGLLLWKFGGVMKPAAERELPVAG